MQKQLGEAKQNNLGEAKPNHNPASSNVTRS
jgi:hypothetical protein